MKAVSLSGQRFGRLTALTRRRENGVTSYWCVCDCGKKTWVQYHNLRSGNTSSCGCFKLEVLHRRKQPDEIIRLNVMWRYYKQNAKLRGVEWALDKDTFRFFVMSACRYCGWNTDWVGIDRVDNTLGYAFMNCVPCCRWCNWGKNERTLAEFKDWVRRLYELVHG